MERGCRVGDDYAGKTLLSVLTYPNNFMRSFAFAQDDMMGSRDWLCRISPRAQDDMGTLKPRGIGRM